MKVKINNPKQEVVFEQALESEVGVIAEMLTSSEKIDNYIPGLSAKAKSIAEANSDEHPEYPIVRVEEGWSGNGRLWDAQELNGIAQQVNDLEPVGYWGHMNPQNVDWEAPVPQTTWLGAITKDEPSRHKERKGEMVRVFYAAGYNLPLAPVRQYIKSRAVRGVSWFGSGKQIIIPGKGVQMRGFKLKSLDWARKLAEGMPGTSIAAIASEMNGGNMDKELAQVSPDEFKKENPNGYALLVSEVTQAKDEKIAEMEEAVEAVKAEVSLLARLREILGLDEKADVLEVVGNLMQKSGEMVKGTFEKHLDKILEGKVQDAKTRGMVRRLVLAEVPAAEMEEKDEDAVSEMVTEMFDKDEDIKHAVSTFDSNGRNLGSGERERSNGKSALVSGSTKL